MSQGATSRSAGLVGEARTEGQGAFARLTRTGSSVREVASAGLERAIHDIYGCGSTLLEVVPVVASVEGQASLFAVTVFRLIGHPTASRCYAWSSAVERSARTQYVLVLDESGVNDAESAVARAMASQRQAAAAEAEPSHRVLSA